MSSRSTYFRNALLGASAIVSVASLATPAAAAAQAVTFDLPAQPLTQALKAYGATADQQLIYSERLVQGRTAPALKGEYSPEQALSLLLAGSGLTADRTPGGVVTIRSAASDPQSSGAAAGGAEVEALIVTAQKREEDIQDVPIAISAFTQEKLENSQVAGGPDLMTQVPNMTFTKTNFSSYSIQIRGIGTQAISATTDPAVAIAFNNTPFVENRFFEQEFYDLQRIEVLRGPQGTLYGRNATGGVVNLISAKPKFNFEAKLGADVANYGTTRLEGMVNIPLVEDTVALRLAGAWTKRDGYATNEITGNPIDGRDLWSTRVSLRFTPNDRLDANLIWEHFQEDDDRIRSGKQLCMTDEVTSIAGFETSHFDVPPGLNQGTIFQGSQATTSQGCAPNSFYDAASFQTPNGLSLPYYTVLGAIGLPRALLDPYESRTQSRDLRVIESTVDPHYLADSDVVEFQLSFDVTDDLTLSSETGWASNSVFSTQDYNRFNTQQGAWRDPATAQFPRENLARLNDDGYWEFFDPQIGWADRLVAVDLSTGESKQFSQEFRLASDYDGPFNFSLGANFLRYDTEDKYYVFINSLTLISAVSPYGNYL
ncbi:MAG TPA: TonB-dependent receptor plug domain-containing protein, partial [Caulobacteraceae bacterium]